MQIFPLHQQQQQLLCIKVFMSNFKSNLEMIQLDLFFTYKATCHFHSGSIFISDQHLKFIESENLNFESILKRNQLTPQQIILTLFP